MVLTLLYIIWYNNSTDIFYKIQVDYNMIKYKRNQVYIEEIVQDTINYHSHYFFELAYIK